MTHLEPRVPQLLETLLWDSSAGKESTEDALVTFCRQGGNFLSIDSKTWEFWPGLARIEELLGFPFDDNLFQIYRTRSQIAWHCPFEILLHHILMMGGSVEKISQELWGRILDKLFENQELLNKPSASLSSFVKIINKAPSISKTYLMRAVTKPCPVEVVAALFSQLPLSEEIDDLWDLLLDYNLGRDELYDEDSDAPSPMTTLYMQCMLAGHEPDATLFKKILDQTKERSAALPASFSNPSEERHYLQEQFDHPRGRPAYRLSQDRLVEFLLNCLKSPLPEGTLMKCLSCGFHERVIMTVIAKLDKVSFAECNKAKSMGYRPEVLDLLAQKSP